MDSFLVARPIKLWQHLTMTKYVIVVQSDITVKCMLKRQHFQLLLEQVSYGDVVMSDGKLFHTFLLQILVNWLVSYLMRLNSVCEEQSEGLGDGDRAVVGVPGA